MLLGSAKQMSVEIYPMEIITMKLKYLFSALIVFFIWQPTVSLAADTIVYSSPKHQGFHLDWCRTFAHGCGAVAANAFCVSKNQLRASAWVKWNNPGFRTMTIGENSICDPQHHNCDSFKKITCVKKVKTFIRPKHRGYRLDWCRTFAHGCGAPAAKAFCQKKGYSVLDSFKKKNNLNVKTMTIGENSICDPQHHNCDSFKWVKCKN